MNLLRNWAEKAWRYFCHYFGSYALWIIFAEKSFCKQITSQQKISVVLIGNTNRARTLKSLNKQSYSHWELTTEKLSDYVVVIQSGDTLSKHAFAQLIAENADIVYSDEDTVKNHRRTNPLFKPGWSFDLFCSSNYLGQLTLLKANYFKDANELLGYSAFERILHILQKNPQACVKHVPHVLYHRYQAVTDILENDVNALNNYFTMMNINAFAKTCPFVKEHRKVTYLLPDELPLVSLIIPTRDQVDYLKRCIESILVKTTYPYYEIIIVDNQSSESQTHAYFEQLKTHNTIRILKYSQPFNYSAINNFAATHAKGSILGLINNDTEVMTPNWLNEMLQHALRKDIGAVGAMLYYSDERVQHAGVVIGIAKGAGHLHRLLPRGARGHLQRALQTQNFSAVTAACLLVRKEVYEQVGGLNEQLAVAFNDVDFCLRLLKAGYRNLFTPYAELYHHESVSRGYDFTPEKAQRLAKEAQYLQTTWDIPNFKDIYYNPNLTLRDDSMALAFKR